MKKVLAATAATLLAVGIGAATVPADAATTTTTATKAPAAAPEYNPPPIKWGPCDNPTLKAYGAQCGFLVVPIDYAKPTGNKIKLAVSRALHKPGAKYQGIMISNPGGPGGSGLVLPILQGRVPNGGGDGYDWIGFDPRGVGSSVPALTCDPSYVAAPRQPYRPSTNKILNYWLDKSAKYANACLTKPAIAEELFKHIHTTDNVADIESIRKALGQQQINYYGFSYGTYIGQVYATLHPSRVRRFVFDGVEDGAETPYQSNLNQDVAFQKTFDIYFQWLARYHQVYNVGDTYKQVRDKFLKTQAALDKKPVGKLGGDELIDVFTSAGYYTFDWATIAQAYSAYLNGGDASGLTTMYTDANDTGKGGDNGFALYLGTQCTDAQWPQSLTKVLNDNAKYDKTKASYFAWPNGWFNGPCNYWPFKASKPVEVTGAKVTSKLLFVEETYDAATPYAGALNVRKLFPTASLVEGVGGSTHAGTLHRVTPCEDNTVAQYLLTGQTPKRLKGNQSDAQCSPVPQPNPEAVTPTAQAKVAAPNAALAVVGRDPVQQALAAAQRP